MSVILHDPVLTPITISPPAAVPCPRWCTLPAGHAPDVVDVDGTLMFWHHAVVLADDPDGRRLDLRAVTSVLPDGQLEHEPPAVMLDGRPDVLLTADQARRQAAALLLAADLLDGGVR